MITTQRELRRLFFSTFPDVPRKKIRNYAGDGLMYPTDTCCAWVDWIDGLQRDGIISEQLAERATLD